LKKEDYTKQKYVRRQEFMTEKEMKEVNDRITKLLLNRGEMGDLYGRWEKEEEGDSLDG
jgi:hypothetical protein